MIRYGLGILVATTACAAVGLAACGDSIKDAGTGPVGTAGGSGSGGAGNTGGSGTSGAPNGGAAGAAGATSGLTFPTTCTGACCPAPDACYVDKTKSGAECLAMLDNTGKDHIQMRQAWIKATTPKGNTDSLVYGVLAGRTQLPWPECYQGGQLGSGGYIQLIDFFLGGSTMTPPVDDYSLVGYSTFVPDAAARDAALANGFTYGMDVAYKVDAGYELTAAQMDSGANFPPGLPKPMANAPGGWKTGPTKAKRLDADFDLTDQTVRKDLLAKLDATTGDYGKQGYGGVFYYDKPTGTAHGYGAMGWTIVYAQDGKTHLSIPIREVETRSKFNDPAHPNCVGLFRGDALDPGASPKCQTVVSTDPAYGGGNCGDHACAPGTEAPATTDGYFLISELEQIYSPDLQKTLCVSYPGTDPANAQKNLVESQGFYDPTKKSCRTAKWDATKPDGMPPGDWCAATNSAATPTCRDAWHSHSLHVYVGSKISAAAPVAF